MLCFNLGYSSVYFDATDFLQETYPGTYDMDQHLIYYGVGLVIRLTGNPK